MNMGITFQHYNSEIADYIFPLVEWYMVLLLLLLIMVIRGAEKQLIPSENFTNKKVMVPTLIRQPYAQNISPSGSVHHFIHSSRLLPSCSLANPPSLSQADLVTVPFTTRLSLTIVQSTLSSFIPHSNRSLPLTLIPSLRQ